jgi:hypothetical protein
MSPQPFAGKLSPVPVLATLVGHMGCGLRAQLVALCLLLLEAVLLAAFAPASSLALLLDDAAAVAPRSSIAVVSRGELLKSLNAAKLDLAVEKVKLAKMVADAAELADELQTTPAFTPAFPSFSPPASGNATSESASVPAGAATTAAYAIAGGLALIALRVVGAKSARVRAEEVGAHA